jgi:gamma-glutamyltranspeptidase/glutathione hydrolase
VHRIVLAVCAVVIGAQTVQAADRVTGLPFATRSEVIAPEAMAATSQPLATQIALQVMRDGGNAIDAASA